jgi:hypothetical protein
MALPDLAVLRRVSACWRSRLRVPIGEAGAANELIAHLLSMVARHRRALLTVGWIITGTG